CGVLCQADHAVLSGGVGGSTSEGFDSGAGGVVHDCAATMLQHQRDLVFHTQEHAAEVYRNDPVPLRFGDLGDDAGLLFGTGVVEGNVETTEGVDRLVQCSLHVLRPGDVAADGESAAAEFGDHAGRLVVALVGDVGDHDSCALSGERQCRRAAHAAPCTGHERDPAGEAAVLIRSSSHG